jgi:hypothetical protein
VTISRERQVPSRVTEPLQWQEVDSPPRSAHTTDKPVHYAAVVDRNGTILGYVWVNDEDDAAGWQYRRAGGDEAFNQGVLYVSMLHDAKARGLRPTGALAEILRDSHPGDHSHVVPGSVEVAPSLQTVKDLTGSHLPDALTHAPDTARGDQA